MCPPSDKGGKTKRAKHWGTLPRVMQTNYKFGFFVFLQIITGLKVYGYRSVLIKNAI